MKIFLVILTVVLSTGCNLNPSKEQTISKDDFRQSKRAFAELNEALKQGSFELWNQNLEGPLMLVNSKTRLIIANEADLGGALTRYKGLYVGKLPDNMNVANTALDWNGKRWTMVMLPLPKTKAERLNILIHESFHRIQPYIGFDSLSDIQSFHLDKKDGRVLLRLELEALKEALRHEHSVAHIKNALLFRQYRYQLYPNAKESENSLEIIEGLAEFTGAMLSGRSSSELMQHLVNQIDWFYELPTFVRSFAYFTIPIYGYFLSQHDDGWNLKLNRNSNLTDIILDFFDAEKQNIDFNTVSQIGQHYNILSIIDEEEKREAKMKEELNALKELFTRGKTLIIKLEKMSISFNPSTLIPLDTLGTIYPTLRVVDNWGILEVDSIGALISPSWREVTIPFPSHISDSLIQGLGWKLKLKENWRIQKKDEQYRVIKSTN